MCLKFFLLFTFSELSAPGFQAEKPRKGSSKGTIWHSGTTKDAPELQKGKEGKSRVLRSLLGRYKIPDLSSIKSDVADLVERRIPHLVPARNLDISPLTSETEDLLESVPEVLSSDIPETISSVPTEAVDVVPEVLSFDVPDLSSLSSAAEDSVDRVLDLLSGDRDDKKDNAGAASDVVDSVKDLPSLPPIGDPDEGDPVDSETESLPEDFSELVDGVCEY